MKGGDCNTRIFYEERKRKARLPRDVFRLTDAVVRGYGASLSRTVHSDSGDFNRRAIAAVEAAICTVAAEIENDEVRNIVRRKVFDSAVERIPYEYMGECYCGRQKFYRYRMDFYREVAKQMGFLTV